MCIDSMDIQPDTIITMDGEGGWQEDCYVSDLAAVTVDGLALESWLEEQKAEQ